MSSHQSFARKNYVIFVGLMILLVAGMLAVIAHARLNAFHQHNLDVGHESLTGVEKQVAFYIAEKQRMVDVFAKEKIDWLRALARSPNNEELHENLGELLRHYFPKYFAFSIADNKGEPLFEDFDGLIGELCLAEVKQFSTSKKSYHPYIHPNVESYHFDIMVHYGEDGNEGVFFVSFLADVLGDIVNSIQSPGHQIMLILPQEDKEGGGLKDLIEITAAGARNHLIRDDYRLTQKEQALIAMRHGIPGTRWQAVDFHNTTLHASFRNSLIKDSIGIFLVFLTIAALLIIRLRREERQREFAEQQKQALMGVVSHEFRSPTAVIKSALDLVSDGDAGKVSPDIKKYIDMALSSTSHLMRLVNDFLDLQKIESGNLSINKQDCKLSRVVKDAVVRNGLYAEQFSVSFELQEPLAGEMVSCDAQRIEQVLTNFLSNAAKYGGKNDVINISVERIDHRLRVSVRDHGAGIPLEFQPQVFDKFTMSHVKQTNQKKGLPVQSSGLGLSIVKAIIKQHGGSVGFDTTTEPSDKTGTSFWFELPIL